MDPEVQKLKELCDFYGDFDYTGYSAKVLAERFGVDKSTISRWLNGEVKPHKKHLEKIRELLAEKGEKYTP